MIQWTIDAALDSGRFEYVLVSTDDMEIAEVAIAAGAHVPFLRTQHADDYSPVSQAVCAALDQSEAFWRVCFDQVVQLMPNCPLRTGHDIEQAMRRFETTGAEFQISVFRYGWMNPWWALRLNPDQTAEPLFPEASRRRSQDLPELYCPTGAIWIARSESLRRVGTFYGPGYTVAEMPWHSAVDIDEPADLRMAEMLMLMGQDGPGAGV